MIASRVGSSRWTSSSHERHPGASMMRPMTERKNSRRAAALSGLAWNSFIRVIGMSAYRYGEQPLVKMRPPCSCTTGSRFTRVWGILSPSPHPEAHDGMDAMDAMDALDHEPVHRRTHPRGARLRQIRGEEGRRGAGVQR